MDPDPSVLRIDDHTSISMDELRFRKSRSAGPGGQNVNKVNTKVSLLFDVAASEALDESQKARLRNSLHTRINKEGILSVSSQRFRTQAANRRATLERFEALLKEALATRPQRKATRPTRTSQRHRVREKRQRGRIKQLRGRVEDA